MSPERQQRISALYHDALMRPREARPDFVAAACGSDEALRREVESLLVQAVTDDSFLERPPVMTAPRLSPGQTLGDYQVVGLLGAGGMGEVYRARDTKLDRDVALKVLPAAFVSNPERVARLRREAKTLAALNHPHIAAIYGLESHGTAALILELVEGATLADRIAQGAIPVDEALPIAKQIAEALEAAHEQGIIHRDLKPANVKVRPDGTVKVLDFGLAKALDTGPTALDPAHSPTITSPAMMTGVGVLLGTAAYMSPEQARGRAVDRRADIWAFGAVLYEMLTGERAFDAEDVSMTLSKVLQREPDFDALPPTVPARVSQALRVCLRKDSKQRAGDIRDVRLALEGAFETVSPQTATLTAPARNRRLAWMAASAITLVAAVLAVPTVRHLRETPPALAVATHLELSVRPADQLVGSIGSVRPSRTALAISPDGRLVVFSATRGTITQLYLRGLDRAEATPVPGTDGGLGPFFSPDGAWIGFWADRKLKKVPTAGGPAAMISDAPLTSPPLSGASWAEDGTIFFAGGPISKVSSAGGTATTVATPDVSKGERFLLPQPLPGGKALLFTVMTGIGDWETANVVLQSLDTGERRVLVQGAADARYVSTGHLVYMKTGTLMAVAFDPRSAHLTGAPVALIDAVMQGVNARDGMDETGAGQFAVSTSGTLLYVAGGIGPILNRSLVWVDRTGAAQPLAAAPAGPYGAPRLSPDGQKVALVVRRGASRMTDVWVYDVLSGAPTKLTFGGLNANPIWSSDSKRIVYGSTTTTTGAAGVSNVYATNADGSGTPERLAPSDSNQAPSSWSSAANAIAFSSGGIWVLPMVGDRKPWSFLESKPGRARGSPEFSPDGHWMAYVSNETGTQEVYVQPYPGGGEKIHISTAGGVEPIWVANGQEIVYRTRAGQGGGFFSVAIRSLSPFRKEMPRLLFEDKANEYLGASPNRGWDASADGQRFLLARALESTDKPVTVMHVVLNWTEELKRLVPMR